MRLYNGYYGWGKRKFRLDVHTVKEGSSAKT